MTSTFAVSWCYLEAWSFSYNYDITDHFSHFIGCIFIILLYSIYIHCSLSSGYIFEVEQMSALA